jgi:hypothetical protein
VRLDIHRPEEIKISASAAEYSNDLIIFAVLSTTKGHWRDARVAEEARLESV